MRPCFICLVNGDPTDYRMFRVMAAGGVILKALLNVMEKTVQNLHKVLAALTASSVNRAFVRAQISLGFY